MPDSCFLHITYIYCSTTEIHLRISILQYQQLIVSIVDQLLFTLPDT